MIKTEQITDFKYLTKYYCTLHNCFHLKFRTETIAGKKKKVPTDSFVLCQEFAVKLSDSELWQMKFRKSFNRYSIKKHKEVIGSKCQ